VRQHGNGGVGTTCLNTATFLDRNTRLTYVVDEFVDRQLIRLRGQNKTVMAVDTMTFQPVGSEPSLPTPPTSPLKASPASSPRCSSPPSNASATKQKPVCAKALNQLRQADPNPDDSFDS
jgi:hypothetical protein